MMSKMDILFINPSDQAKTFQKLAKLHTPISTPSWIMLLAQSMLKDNDVAIYDIGSMVGRCIFK